MTSIALQSFKNSGTFKMRTIILLLSIVTINAFSSFSVERRFGLYGLESTHPRLIQIHTSSCRLQSTASSSSSSSSDSKEEIITNFDGDQYDNDKNIEKTWRYVKKPLLRIGSKGATSTHGNSLRQLLESHITVKVKVNVIQFDSLKIQSIFEELCQYAEQNGAPSGIEFIQARASERTILFAMPGTLELITKGEYPPPPPPPYVPYNKDSVEEDADKTR